MQNAVDPYIVDSHSLTQAVNKSIESLQLRKEIAEDTMNVFTAIIELRSSCQMVSSKLRELEHDIKNKSEGDFGTLENAVYFMNKSISLVQMLGVDGEN